MWICPNCSRGNDDAHSFCTECGGARPQTPRVQEPTWEAPRQTGYQPPVNNNWNPAPVQPKKKSNLPLIIGLAALSVLLVCLVLFLIVGVGKAPRFRQVYKFFQSYDGSTSEEIYTFNGDNNRLETYEDGRLAYVSTLTLNDQGYVATEDYRRASGEAVFFFEYGYDKNGNMDKITRYTAEGKVDLTITRVYNDYRVIEHQESVYYNDDGSLDYRTIVEFSDMYNGVSYDLDASNQRTENWVYRRTYDSNNNMTEEWCYNPDGSFFRVNLYERDENHLILNYTVRYFDDDESHYTYRWEKIK